MFLDFSQEVKDIIQAFLNLLICINSNQCEEQLTITPVL